MLTRVGLRSSWPLLLLVAGLLCIGVALVEARRSERANRAVADRALAGYAEFAAWSYQEHLSESLRIAAQETLGMVNMVHATKPIPDAASLSYAMPWSVACACRMSHVGPSPAAFIGFRLGTDTVAVSQPMQRGAEGRMGDMMALPPGNASIALGADDRRWMNGALTGLARTPLSRWGYQVLVARHGDSSLAFALTVMPTTWGDTIVYAVQYSGRALDSLLNTTLDREDLLPVSLAQNGSNRAILAAEVRDAAGNVLLAANAPANWRLDATATLPPSYGGLRIRMALRAGLADRAIIGGVPRSRLPVLLGLLALAAGLAIVAVVQLKREAEFARARTDFVASTSHELRTPLTQIRLVIDMLRLDREPDAARREASLALVDREVTRLQHLVDSVLHFSRGAGARGGARERVDVPQEVRSVVAEFAPLASARKVELDVHTEPCAGVALRSGALRQVVLNLLDNALKYGPPGQRISVRVTPLDQTGVRLTVADEGPGVLPGDRQRIWDPFVRGAGPAVQAAGGSGIGLTVVREIVESHGGRYRVEEADGGGARFVIDMDGAA